MKKAKKILWEIIEKKDESFYKEKSKELLKTIELEESLEEKEIYYFIMENLKKQLN